LEKRERGRIQGLPNFLGYPLLSQEREKLLISNLASTFRGSIRTKIHEKFWRKGSVGVSRDCRIFLDTPYYLRNEKSYGFQIWPVGLHSEGPSEQKPMKNVGEKEAWAYPGTADIFWGTPYLRNGKSYGLQIWPVYSEGPSEQKPIKNFREKRAWAYPGTAQFLGVPPIISGTGKATDFKIGQYIHRVHPNKTPLNILEKRERGHMQGLPNLFGYPLLSQERLKLRTSNFVRTFIGSIGTKAH